MIQQVAFEVPDEIAVKLAAGELVQYGGVVRDLNGRIVKHLKPVPVPQNNNAAMRLAVKATNIAKENKALAIGAFAVAGVATAGGVAYGVASHIKNKKAAQAQETAIDVFNAAFTDYLRALNGGELTAETVDALESAIDSFDNNMGFTVEIKGKQFKSLVKAVRSYTDRLAKANGLKTKPALFKAFEKKSNGIDALQECLATQKAILDQAA